MYRIVLPAALLALSSCKTTEKNQQQAEPKLSPSAQATAPSESTKPAARPEPELDPTELRWGMHPISELGVKVPVLGGIEVKTGEMGESKYVRQIQKPLMTAVWYGYGRSLEAWRGGYAGNTAATFGPEESITSCGKAAKRQELSMAATQVAIRRPAAMQLNSGIAGPGVGTTSGEVTHAAVEDKPVIRDNPARTQVAIELTLKETPVVITWTIETDKREAFAAAEKHYFHSLCSP